MFTVQFPVPSVTVKWINGLLSEEPLEACRVLCLAWTFWHWMSGPHWIQNWDSPSWAFSKELLKSPGLCSWTSISISLLTPTTAWLRRVNYLQLGNDRFLVFTFTEWPVLSFQSLSYLFLSSALLPLSPKTILLNILNDLQLSAWHSELWGWGMFDKCFKYRHPNHPIFHSISHPMSPYLLLPITSLYSIWTADSRIISFPSAHHLSFGFLWMCLV